MRTKGCPYRDPSIAQGQYGFPPRFGFSPSVDIGYWKPGDSNSLSHLLAIPPEVTVGPGQLAAEMVLRGNRNSAACVACSYPMSLVPLGAEYWVVKSDPALASTTRNLRVRVHAEGILSTFCCKIPGRLMVSVIGYTQASDTLNSLWRHPEWATAVFGPQWVDVDTLLAGPVDVVVPNFGSANGYKAAVVVISLEDGPQGYWAGQIQNTFTRNASASLRSQPLVLASLPAHSHSRRCFTRYRGALSDLVTRG